MKGKLLLSTALLSFFIAGCGSPVSSSPGTNATGNAVKGASSSGSNSTSPTNSTSTTSNTDAGVHPQPVAKPYLVAVHHRTKVEDVTYAQFHAISNASVEAKLNTILSQAAAFKPGKNTVDSSDLESYSATYVLAFQQGNIADIMVDTYVMPNGAAHGMPSEQSLWLNLSTGQQYSASDLFRSSSSYVQAISSVIQKEDTTHKLDTFQVFTGVTNKDGFVLQPEGLTVFFSPYEWASFADGFLAYDVPYSALDATINKSGSLWQALQSEQAQNDNRIQVQDEIKIRSLGYEPVDIAENHQLSTAAFAAEPDGHGNTLYAFTATKSGSQADEKIFFFDGSHYLGTDTLKSHGPVITLTPTTLASISATYVSTTKPYQFTIQYHWDGAKLVPNSSFPANYTDWH